MYKRQDFNDWKEHGDYRMYHVKNSPGVWEVELQSGAIKHGDLYKLKVRRLQSASRTAVKTHYPMTVRLRDTVVLRDTLTVADTLRRLHYENPWLTFDGTIGNYIILLVILLLICIVICPLLLV